MIKNKHSTKILVTIVILSILLSIVFMFGQSLGMSIQANQMKYESNLFSDDRVHEINIIIDETNWQKMRDDAQAKEYYVCDLVIDNQTVQNVAIRTKGNSSLSSVAQSDSDRYSFKIEFDHYVSGKNFQGLDKLALNNIIQDNTYMKDYVSYKMMDAFDVDSPLCSFIDVKINGEDFGLYLAVEGIEDSFVQRTYGSNYGNIYKPDSMDMNDKEKEFGDRPARMEGGPPEFNSASSSSFSGDQSEFNSASSSSIDGVMQMPDGMFGNAEGSTQSGGMAPGGGGGMGGMGSNDVALIYSDDEISSYSNIFDNAIFDVDKSDKKRLIQSIKQINEGENLSEVINIDEVLRYFVVHNFLLNFDSYTGSMMHNYYLYEKDGQISMIAWDYNLAFGAMSDMGGDGPGRDVQTATVSDTIGVALDDATKYANFAIDTPVSGTTMEKRPLLNSLLTNDEYLEQYHNLFADFITEYFESGQFTQMYENAIALISPYVEKDPTAFCTYDEFLIAQEQLEAFCNFRAESIVSQLNGDIASTTEGQEENSYAGFIDASSIDLDSMGNMGMGGGGGLGGGGFRGNEQSVNTKGQEANAATLSGHGQMEDIDQVAVESQGNGPQMPNNMQDFSRNNIETESQNSNIIIIAVVSIIVLVAGIVFVKLFKKGIF